ncbi:AAA family ATPase [Haloarcula sp. Atlit-7R]|uniref:AAA family ATPase n=1 Tax=Haloarcula sp. Atlit-7R TaxID=2282125 RepID=UPI000EF17176|nr:AAA family ATPase [Haloarcula sp. Atlit-7R]RLM91123.1 AAA family ATPase [Haloarcula sp. Atlit-7R]
MKISRLEIENFAIDESPTITEDTISGDDLLLSGGNRSGKTLTFNAILYALYGRSGTFGVTSGQHSTVNVHFDNTDAVLRDRKHTYEQDGQSLNAGEGVKSYIGAEENVSLQFITANPANQPISALSGEDLLNRIRALLSAENQTKIKRHRRAKHDLVHLREIRRRGQERPSIRQLEENLNSLPISSTQNRIVEIEELRELIESGEIESISARLQAKDEVAERLDELYDRRRSLEDQLKQKRRELSDTSRYTQKVNDLIIDAIQEFTCPVCGRLVEEETARNRLPNRCPQCGRDRDLSELREQLREKVDSADDRIEGLKEEIGELEKELSEVKAEITELKESEPELQDLNQFVRTALKQAGYDIDQLQERTDTELAQKREDLEEFKSRKEELSTQLEKRQELLNAIDESISAAEAQIEELKQEAFEEIRETFTDRLSEVYQEIAPGLGTEVGLTPDGELEFPGTGSEGIRPYDRLSSGEKRLVNLAFGLTVAQFAQENEDAHNWEVLVLDEPLTNLESDIQDAAARYLRDAEIQCIMTSPLDRIQSHFQDDQSQIIQLNRIRTEATTLDEYL